MIGTICDRFSEDSERMKMGAFRPEREREGVSERCLRPSRTDRGPQGWRWDVRWAEKKGCGDVVETFGEPRMGRGDVVEMFGEPKKAGGVVV